MSYRIGMAVTWPGRIFYDYFFAQFRRYPGNARLLGKMGFFLLRHPVKSVRLLSWERVRNAYVTFFRNPGMAREVVSYYGRYLHRSDFSLSTENLPNHKKDFAHSLPDDAGGRVSIIVVNYNGRQHLPGLFTKTFFSLLIFKTTANLKTEVSQYYLNYFWWVIEPVLTMAVFYVVFGILLNRGTEHFAAFLLCGLTAWNWFNRTVNNAAGSILGGRGLMLQVNIPKSFFPLEVFLRDGFKHLFVVALLLIFLVFYPTPVSITWLALPVLMVVQAVLVLGAAVFCAALVPFVPDLKFIISTLLMLMFFGTGVFFDIDTAVLPEHRSMVYLNPMAGLLKNYRAVLIYEQWPDWWYLFKVLVAGSIILWFSLRVVRRFDHIYPRVCQ